jgi:peptide/nickel transport system permease protein
MSTRRPTRIRISLWYLGLLHAAVLLAGFLAPYPYAEQHRDYPYAPPSRIHWFDSRGGFHARPFVYGIVPDLPLGGYREDPGHLFPIRFWVPVAGQEDSWLFRFPRRLFGVSAPGIVLLLGSDGYGRDVFSRVMYGGQVSLFTGILAAALSLVLGLALGTAAGFFGGWLDAVLMRGGELVMALPWLYLLLAVRALLPLHISTLQAFFLLIAIIGGVGWVRPSRLVRGVVLTARESGFVQAARGFGAGPAYLIRRHILPATFPVILTQATVLIPQYILAEVALSFLGLGVGQPVPSWGNMLAEARQYHALLNHPWLLAPGLAAVPILLGYLALADGLEGREDR